MLLPFPPLNQIPTMNNKLILPAFAIMVMAHFYFPVQMIMEKEKTLTSGKEFRFRTAPIDPSDPFRGKYVALSFEQTSGSVRDAEGWNHGDPVFVSIINDSSGFAMVKSLSQEPPVDTEDYIKATINYVVTDTLSWVSFTYPFDRFYMEESKATNAELAYNEAAADTGQLTYALVMVRNGDAVVKDVLINGVPIVEAARNY